MSKTYVQLARTGDILNILPLLWADAQKGDKPRLMVQKDYAPLLEGVSYVEPLVFDGAPHEIARAVAQAETYGAPVICTQVNGPLPEVEAKVYKRAGMQTSRTTSFQKEQWRLAGRLAEWDNAYPLVFNQRSAEREAALIEPFVKKLKKPLLLVNLDGISSPFPYRDLLWELVTHCNYAVLDLGKVRAERFYDLLGLYEKAIGLVAIDSAPLHLAYACPTLPVLALANDRPMLWHGASWRGQYEFYCRYHDFPERAVELCETLRALASRPSRFDFVHVWNAQADTKRRPEHTEGWRLTPILPGMAGRQGPPEKPEYPYLRDCLRMALQRTRAEQRLVLSRPDTVFEPKVEEWMLKQPACYAYRIQSGTVAPVVDMFCAAGQWWKAILPKIPDLLLANDFFWSHALWALFQQNGALDITGAVYRPATTAAAKTGISPAATFNRGVSEKFVSENHVYSRYPKVTDQVETQKLDLRDLKPFAYNPAIIEEQGWIQLAYRYHHTSSPATRLVVAQLEESGKVLSNREIIIDDRSSEDPKLFRLDGKLYMSFVSSTWPSQPPLSVVRYAELFNGELKNIQTPPIGKNNWTGTEKNWVLWDSIEELAIIYQCSPVQRVHVGLQVFETEGPRWFWGPAKGGTPPLPFGNDDVLIRFFHSTLDTELGKFPRRYFVGAYTMSAYPPFEVLQVSKRPIIYGSEVDDLKVKQRPFHWKANVVFPGGAIAAGDGWTVSLGVNDCQCVLAKITPADLNL